MEARRAYPEPVIVSPYHFLLGPFVVSAALAVIILICRWVFSTGHRDERTATRLNKAQSTGDFGLLVPIATVRTADDAAMLREVLSAAGIRSTLGEGDLGTDVLVFRADAVRARDLVSS